MKQGISGQKSQHCVNRSIAEIKDADYNWDSFEIMAQAYLEKIKEHEQTLNQLIIMDDAKLIIHLCDEIKLMKRRVKRGW